jgi:hypothetical protein
MRHDSRNVKESEVENEKKLPIIELNVVAIQLHLSRLAAGLKEPIHLLGLQLKNV